MKNVILWVVGLLIIAAGWYLYSSKGSLLAPPADDETAQTVTDADTEAEATPVSEDATVNPDADAIEAAVTGVPATVITFIDSGFVPSSVTVKKGQIVRWMNNSGSKVWPASAVHPSHEVYPQKSPSDCLGSSFDACLGLAQGESWDFKFDYIGEWKFHNHLNASQWGVVNVTE